MTKEWEAAPPGSHNLNLSSSVFPERSVEQRVEVVDYPRRVGFLRSLDGRFVQLSLDKVIQHRHGRRQAKLGGVALLFQQLMHGFEHGRFFVQQREQLLELDR